MGIDTFVRYVRRSRLPDQQLVARHYFALSPVERRQTLAQEVSRAHFPAIQLALSGPDRVFAGFSLRQRTAIFRSVLENCCITSIGEFLEPTPRKMQDLMRAALTLPEELEGLRREAVSHLASYLRFDDLAPEFKIHPFFANFIRDDIPQGILSSIRNRDGNTGTLAGHAVCSAMERKMNEANAQGQLVLVNRHLLFKKRPDWSAALCLRDFFSRQGNIFVKGMYYFVAGSDHRAEIELTREPIFDRPRLLWQPSRYFDPFSLGIKQLAQKYRRLT